MSGAKVRVSLPLADSAYKPVPGRFFLRLPWVYAYMPIGSSFGTRKTDRIARGMSVTTLLGDLDYFDCTSTSSSDYKNPYLAIQPGVIPKQALRNMRIQTSRKRRPGRGRAARKSPLPREDEVKPKPQAPPSLAAGSR